MCFRSPPECQSFYVLGKLQNPISRPLLRIGCCGKKTEWTNIPTWCRCCCRHVEIGVVHHFLLAYNSTSDRVLRPHPMLWGQWMGMGGKHVQQLLGRTACGGSSGQQRTNAPDLNCRRCLYDNGVSVEAELSACQCDISDVGISIGEPPKVNFSGDYISALRGCWPLKF